MDLKWTIWIVSPRLWCVLFGSGCQCVVRKEVNYAQCLWNFFYWSDKFMIREIFYHRYESLWCDSVLIILTDEHKLSVSW